MSGATPTSKPTIAAIILAGGQGSRLGGVRKWEIEVAGASLLDRAVAAATSARAHPVVIVGEPRVPGTITVQEDPPRSGPLAAVFAGLAAASAPWFLLLSGDLVDPAAAVHRLLEPGIPDADGRCLTDADGRPQWLAGLYRAEPARAVLARLGKDGVRDTRVRALFDELQLEFTPDLGTASDIDTPEDLDRAGALLPPSTRKERP